MPISTDRLSDSEISKLSPSSQTLIKLRDRIEKKWAEKARQNLKSAAHLDTPILIETFPGYLENIAESLTPNYPRAHATERTTLAQEHGGERARLTSFDLDQLIAEYHLLKETIFEVMESEIKLSAEDKSVIELSIDMGIREAVTAFTLV